MDSTHPSCPSSSSNATLAPLARLPTARHEPDMLAWSRLPTPIPHDLLSPPQSGSSSPRLSISTSAASTSHGSYALPSPLPSPLEPSTSPSAKHSAPPSGSKTAAFFASPFSSSSGPAPPPPPPRPPPTRSTSLNITIDASTPQPQPVEPGPTPTASRSATADFFSSNGSTAAWRPTPPPSLKSSASSNASSSSREPSPPRLPPISRFFPSRYTSEAHRISDDDNDDDGGGGGVTGHGYAHAHFDGGGPHDEPERRFDRDHTKNGQRKKLVPTGGDWETSFKRAFLSLAKKVDPLHTHTHTTTSPTRERTISPPPSLRRDASEAVSSDTVIAGAAPHASSYPIVPGNENAHALEQIPRPSSHLHSYPSPDILDQQSHQPSSAYPSPPHLHVSRASHAHAATHVPPYSYAYALPNPHPHILPLSQLQHPSSHAQHGPHAHPIRRETLHKKNIMPLSLPVPSAAVDTVRSPASDGADSESASSYRAGSILCAELEENETDNTKVSKVKLELLEPLGEGAFSSVWLAKDLSGELARSHSRSLSRSRSRKHARNDSSTSNASSEPVRLIALETVASSRTGAQRGTAGLGAGYRRKSESRAKRGSDSKRMHGIRPTANVGFGTTHDGYRGAAAEDADVRSAGDRSERSADESLVLGELDGEGAGAEMFTPIKEAEEGPAATSKDARKGSVVAVKMMNRALCDANDRTRISFVREVEVLRHISHPSIVSYLHSFTTHTHHALVLEYVGGGELFTLVNSDAQYTRVTEPALRRIWGELARAVGWMHGVGLVHRDIKLENILLTSNIFASASASAPAVLPPAHTPLVKLTDFGLSRFVDPAAPLLSTRCGSEAYAAPELVLRRAGGGTYDGRETDAWACGVVLYALATRQLPFDSPPPWCPSSNAPSRAGSLKSREGRDAREGVGAGAAGLGAGAGVMTGAKAMEAESAKEAMMQSKARREMLMRIAQCEYWWPDEAEAEGYLVVRSSAASFCSASSDNGHDAGEREQDAASSSSARGLESESEPGMEEEKEPEEMQEMEMEMEPTPTTRLASAGLKRVVARLLVRDPAKRARMVELWDEPWLRGEGAPPPPLGALGVLGALGGRRSTRSVRSLRSLRSAAGGGVSSPPPFSGPGGESGTVLEGEDDREEEGAEGDEDEEFVDALEDDGMLLDEEHIDSVATQEFDPE